MRTIKIPSKKVIVAGIALIMLLSGFSVIASVLHEPSAATSTNTYTPSLIAPGYYAMNFTESGLPANTYWYIYVGYDNYLYYYYNSTTSSSNVFYLTNGTYIFGNIYQGSSYSFSVTPSQGTVNIDGSNVSIHLTFVNTTTAPVKYYNHYFNITNLPSVISGINWYWYISLQGVNVSYSNSYYFYGKSGEFTGLRVGEYSYSIGSVSGTSLTPASGTITVNSNATTFIKFNKLYEVSFIETGLQSSQSFSVSLSSLSNTSLASYDYVTFMVANGTYQYSVNSYPNGYSPNPSVGTVYVNGGSVVVNIKFSLGQPTYRLTFNVTNLPSSIPNGNWYFEVDLYQNATFYAYTTGTTSATFASLPNGTYFFYVSLFGVGNPPVTSGVSPESGTVVIAGSSVALNLTLLPPISTYYANFTITSYPYNAAGTFFWGVELVNSTGYSTNLSSYTNKISFYGLPADSYTYYLIGYPYSTFKSPKGTFVITNSSVEISVSFTLDKVYAVSYTQTGLQPYSAWGVVMDNGFTYNNSYLNPSLYYVDSSLPYTQQLTNGTYYVQGFVYDHGHYYFTSPQKVVVSGKTVSVTISFSPVGSSSSMSGLTTYLVYGGIAALGLLVGAGIVYGVLRSRFRKP